MNTPLHPETMLTLSEISELLARDPKTIKTWNNKGQGRWPNATQDETGLRAWRVPVSDLVASGDLDPSSVATVESELAARRESRETKELRERIIRLEEKLTAAHALAEERADYITFLRSLARKAGAA